MSTESPAGRPDEPLPDPVARRFAEQLDRMAERAGRRGRVMPGPLEGAEVGESGDDSDIERYASAVAGQLAEAVTWAEPPAGLRQAVLARALGSEQITEPGSDVPPTVEPAQVTGPVGQPAQVLPFTARRRRLVWAVPVAAAAAVLFTFTVIAVDRQVRDTTGPGQTYAAVGTPLDVHAGARVTIAKAAGGFSVLLDAHDLPPAAAGSYYAAWLNNGKVSVPLGSFHARQSGAPIKLWSGVDPKNYPRFTVTLQAEGQPPLPSGQRYLTASLTN